MKLVNRVAIITGASEGIGAALARRFVLEGARVALAARQEAKLQVLANELGEENALVVPTDVTDPNQVRRMVEQTVAHFGGVDILVNNAGMGVLAGMADISPASARRMWDVNFFGAIDCTQAALPHLKQRRGTVVNISSVAGKFTFPFLGSYCGTKAALNAVSNALRMELAGTGVRVLVVCPGFVDTPFMANTIQEGDGLPERLRKPPKGITLDKVARVTVRGILRGKREIVVPAYYRLGYGFRNLFPRLVDGVLARMRG